MKNDNVNEQSSNENELKSKIQFHSVSHSFANKRKN